MVFSKLRLWITPKTKQVWFHWNLILVLWCHICHTPHLCTIFLTYIMLLGPCTGIRGLEKEVPWPGGVVCPLTKILCREYDWSYRQSSNMPLIALRMFATPQNEFKDKIPLICLFLLQMPIPSWYEFTSGYLKETEITNVRIFMFNVCLRLIVIGLCNNSTCCIQPTRASSSDIYLASRIQETQR